MNEIAIRGLEILTHIGVPDEERSRPQKLLVDVVLVPVTAFADLGDDIALTVDYDAAAKRIRELAEARPRKLIETLAAEIAGMLVDEFPARRATVEVRKFILPDTEHVSARCSRERLGQAHSQHAPSAANDHR